MSRRRQKWRVQIDQYPEIGKEMSGPRTIIESKATERPYATNIGLPNNEVDEIVIDGWFHLEQMDTNQYWMSIGGLTVNVQVDGKTGQPRRVVWEPDYQVDGCSYDGGRQPMTAMTDLWLGLGYILTPAIWVLLRGDRKPTPTERNEHERI